MQKYITCNRSRKNQFKSALKLTCQCEFRDSQSAFRSSRLLRNKIQKRYAPRTAFIMQDTPTYPHIFSAATEEVASA